MRVRHAGLLIAAAGLSLGAAPARETVDLLIRGGTIYTGDAAPFTGDVAISGDRISLVGPHLKVTARRTIDARGLVVAPGFIDPHTHAGAQLASDDPATRLIPGFLTQGVTTALIGNDGGGDPDLGKVLGSASSKPVGINYAAYVGLDPVRKKVIGEADRAPTAEELQRMKALVAGAMCKGALGFSTGLFYAPQSFAKTDEIVALAREAAIRGGVYDSHLRDESSYTIGLAAAVQEALDIGREAGMPVHISHIKALGVDVHGQAPAIIARIERAQAAGQKVTADQYPWSASGTSLVASLVPLWAQDGGRAAMLKRFDDPALAARLRADMTENLRRRGMAGALLITEGEQRGRTLEAVARSRGEDPIAAAIAVIRVKDPAVASFNQIEADIEAFMRRPWVMTGSDASTGHPRSYGSFARKYANYVVKRKTISLRDFIYRSATLTADTFGLADRGRLRAGAFADVVLFDPKRFAARATYEQPALLSAGVRAVFVNGVLAVNNGEVTGGAAGRPLPHRPTPGRCP
ncbi:amidohydrolase family protein [Sphingosinicella sp. BN140058]|uniref:N-acyl-D-amino-acid deacylase family protein n=1 Tax=Sphingosinicella sp. BN140058 TaxID=1892855 RepID=UPI0010109785|nr:amidohydrolase family protein [Sphingosinicella sp. BN140058]QAY76196.1 D-aminoacylase [Sphingosinicella sp. BN140058]